MSDMKEPLGPKGKAAITKETKEAIRPVIRELTKKLDKMGFDKKDTRPAIRQGINECADDDM